MRFGRTNRLALRAIGRSALSVSYIIAGSIFCMLAMVVWSALVLYSSCSKSQLASEGFATRVDQSASLCIYSVSAEVVTAKLERRAAGTWVEETDKSIMSVRKSHPALCSWRLARGRHSGPRWTGRMVVVWSVHFCTSPARHPVQWHRDDMNQAHVEQQGCDMSRYSACLRQKWPTLPASPVYPSAPSSYL